jgi:hypothetical protein
MLRDPTTLAQLTSPLYRPEYLKATDEPVRQGAWLRRKPPSNRVIYPATKGDGLGTEQRQRMLGGAARSDVMVNPLSACKSVWPTLAPPEPGASERQAVRPVDSVWSTSIQFVSMTVT